MFFRKSIMVIVNRKINILLILLLFPFHVTADLTFSIDEIGERVPITVPIPEFNPDLGSYPDPFAFDPIILTINKENYPKYLQILTPLR